MRSNMWIWVMEMHAILMLYHDTEEQSQKGLEH